MDWTPIVVSTVTTVGSVAVAWLALRTKIAELGKTATAATSAATLPWWARPESYQRLPATTGAVQQYYDVATTGDLSLCSSAATGTSPRYLSAIRYPAKPI